MNENNNENPFENFETPGKTYSSFHRYFHFVAPLNNIFIQSEKLKRIFEELDKTGLSRVSEFREDIRKEEIKNTGRIVGFGIVGGFLISRIRILSALNRFFLFGVVYLGVFYFSDLMRKEAVLNKLIFSKTHYGQEARILYLN
jgi:hypothetical protein